MKQKAQFGPLGLLGFEVLTSTYIALLVLSFQNLTSTWIVLSHPNSARCIELLILK